MNRQFGQSPENTRQGVTLIEVLMSLMIMSIGISAVAVLFPISVLRSIQATQLTNAAILKYKAEAIVQMDPMRVFDPDGDGNVDEHIRNNTELRYIIDPSGYFDLATTGSTYSVYPTLSTNNVASQPNDDNLRGLADWFGNLDVNSDGIPEPFPSLPRYDGGIRTATINPPGLPNGLAPAGGDPEEARALRYLGSSLSRLGDAWETVLEAFPVEFVFSNGTTSTTAAASATVVGLTLPADVDLSDMVSVQTLVPKIGTAQIIPDPEACRIVIFSADESTSIALPLIAVNNGSKRVVWTEDINFNGTPDAGEDFNMNGIVDVRPLNSDFVGVLSGAFEVGRVLLQVSKTNDYNWLLTVRRGQDGQTRGVDVVVTHNKGITPEEERLFPASFNTSNIAPNSPLVIEVLKSGGMLPDGVTPAEPLVKKSGYVLDVENARWYRISNYVETSVTVGGTTGPGYEIQLETPVVENSLVGAALFLPDVIDVYPMGSVPIPKSLR